MLGALGDYLRLLRVGTSLARHDVVLPPEYRSRLPLAARVSGGVLRLFGGGGKGRPGKRLATALQSLGPTYIKLGQFLATRPDVFGVETVEDLSHLKDDLPPFSVAEATRALAEEFPDKQIESAFGSLHPAVAAASLAQVHRVETPDGVRAVKILRPSVERKVERELSAMRRAARTIETVDRSSHRMEPVAFTNTVAASMEKELDLRLEAGATSEFAGIADAIDGLHVPAVDWDRTGKRVLTTDWIDGIRLTDPESLRKLNNREALATTITQSFLISAIRHGVFHADMHQGNMIVMPDGRLALIDFGIVGRVGMAERRFLAEILYGFIRRDYQRIAEVHFEAGYVPPDRSVGDFAQALRSVGEPIHGKSAADMSMGRILLQLFDFTHTFGMHLRPELVLLQKTMVQVEGVARDLDPQHSIWVAAEPIVEDWIKTELGPTKLAGSLANSARDVSLKLARLPEMMDKVEAATDMILAAQTKPPVQPGGKSAVSWSSVVLVAVIGATAIALTGILAS